MGLRSLLKLVEWENETALDILKEKVSSLNVQEVYKDDSKEILREILVEDHDVDEEDADDFEVEVQEEIDEDNGVSTASNEVDDEEGNNEEEVRWPSIGYVWSKQKQWKNFLAKKRWKCLSLFTIPNSKYGEKRFKIAKYTFFYKKNLRKRVTSKGFLSFAFFLLKKFLLSFLSEEGCLNFLSLVRCQIVAVEVAGIYSRGLRKKRCQNSFNVMQI